MAFPESTLLSLSTFLYFLSFSTLSHSFTSELCNFLRSQSQGYASWATSKMELGLSNLRQLSLKGRVITAGSAEREGYCDGQETENIHPGIWRYMYVFMQNRCYGIPSEKSWTYSDWDRVQVANGGNNKCGHSSTFWRVHMLDFATMHLSALRECLKLRWM